MITGVVTGTHKTELEPVNYSDMNLLINGRLFMRGGDAKVAGCHITSIYDGEGNTHMLDFANHTEWETYNAEVKDTTIINGGSGSVFFQNYNATINGLILERSFPSTSLGALIKSDHVKHTGQTGTLENITIKDTINKSGFRMGIWLAEGTRYWNLKNIDTDMPVLLGATNTGQGEDGTDNTITDSTFRVGAWLRTGIRGTVDGVSFLGRGKAIEAEQDCRLSNLDMPYRYITAGANVTRIYVDTLDYDIRAQNEEIEIVVDG